MRYTLSARARWQPELARDVADGRSLEDARRALAPRDWALLRGGSRRAPVVRLRRQTATELHVLGWDYREIASVLMCDRTSVYTLLWPRPGHPETPQERSARAFRSQATRRRRAS